MSEKMNPTERFSGLAENYALYRPDYPDEAIDYIIEKGKLDKSSTVADIGCGTGISSRLLAARGISVVGIEPNPDMLAQARQHAQEFDTAAQQGQLEFREGKAEATGLADASVDLVLSAQAFHWFDKEKALKEFHRLLKYGSYCALMWNERDELGEFTRSYGDLIRLLSDAASVEVPRGRAGYALLACDLFEEGMVKEFMHQQTLTEEGLLGRAFSTSYVPRSGENRIKLEEELKALFDRFAQGGTVSLQYVTSIYLARKY